jgi:flagellar biosynthesis anti-sigma factor FlgM
MIDRVHPAARPSNQEPRERRRTPLRHQKPPAVAAGDEHAARQSSAEPYDHATASYLAEARQAKIAQLQRAVESGTYHVNAEQVAEKVLSEALVDILA